MAVVLGHNQYGKAENRVVRVFRDGDPNEIVDYNVSVALSGGQDPPHLTGDNSPVLPTRSRSASGSPATSSTTPTRSPAPGSSWRCIPGRG